MGKKYFSEVNILRGLAAIVVVLVHSAPDESGMPDVISLFATCIMGLFFMISGFVNYSKIIDGREIFSKIVKQARGILVPYLIYSVLALLLKLLAGQYESSMIIGILTGNSPNPVLWFLWTLFCVMAISFILSAIMEKFKIKHREICFIAFGIVTYIVSEFFDFGFMNKVLSCFLFVYAGIIVRKNYDGYIKILKNPLVTIACSAIFINSMVFGNRVHIWLYIASVAVVWRLALLLTEKRGQGLTFKTFDLLGNYSFDIYIFSYFVQVAARIATVDILSLNRSLSMLILFVAGLVGPLLVADISKKLSLKLR